jgi:2-oxoglutarate dehydrogenase complex dehydrogenase (E1) component-like enzyme
VYGHKTGVFEVFLDSSVQGQKPTGSHSLEGCKAFVSVADQAIQCNARCGTRYGAFRSGVDDDF